MSGAVVVGGAACQGWWLVVEEEQSGPGRIVAGPFADRTDASWVAGAEHAGAARPVHGVRRADGGLDRRPSPQEWAWLAHLGEQLERLPDGWDADLDEEDPLVTLLVEVAAALCEAGLPLRDGHGGGQQLGGACLTPEPALGGVVVSWRQHDRMSVDRVHGVRADELVQQLMSGTLASILSTRGFTVDQVGHAGGHVVRPATRPSTPRAR